MSLPPSVRFIERDWLSSNNILFNCGDAISIVDTGYKAHAALTQKIVEQAITHQGDKGFLDRIVNTHLHSDHCGGNAALQQHYPNAKTFIPADCAQSVRAWDTSLLTFNATAQDCDRFTFTDLISSGDALNLGGYTWQAIAAAGHDHTMFVLYCEQLRALISADALWENGFGVIFPELDGESGFAEQRATLEQLAKLDVQVVMPGHGPIFTDFAGALSRAHSKLDYLMTDPKRHVRLAGKVLLKFLLLERKIIRIDDLPTLLANAKLFESLQLQLETSDMHGAVTQMVDALCRAGAARKENNILYDIDLR